MIARSIQIYPSSYAEMLKERAGQKYQPSNGTEGEFFTSAWCGECQRDRSMRDGDPIEECDDDELCGIIARTFSHNVEDPGYPTEWQYGADGQPRCTAFVEAGQPIPVKDEHTLDMFTGEDAEGERCV